MSNSRTRELDPLVGQFEHLSDKRRASEALHMLKKIASLVKPIMRQRGWRVGTLREFYPSERALLGLNVNHGEIIQLRLREPYDENQFMAFHMVVDTMLHELCHIVHGPHNEHFHALWARLREEHEALTRKGYTGEGFLGQGNKLGGQRVPMSEVRRRARAAAEQRAIRNKNSGMKLGGQGIMRGQDVRDVIARAAEQRIRINRGCASGTQQGEEIAQGKASIGGEVTRTRADQEDENEAAWIQAMIELVREDDSAAFGQDHMSPQAATSSTSESGNAGQLDPKRLRQEQQEIERSLKRPNPASTIRNSATQTPQPFTKPTPKPTPPPAPQTWTCEICTLINPIEHLMCGACETERPKTPTKNFSTQSPSPSSSSSSKTTKSTLNPNSKPKHPSLQPRLNAYDSLARIESQAASKRDAKPIGWKCANCHNWMEEMWWTCANCGTMKSSS